MGSKPLGDIIQRGALPRIEDREVVIPHHDAMGAIPLFRTEVMDVVCHVHQQSWLRPVELLELRGG
jgi:hypothetical protein